MDKDDKLFGLSRGEVKSDFAASKDYLPTNTPKAFPDESGLQVLAKGSQELLKENPDFLTKIYED